MAGVHRKERGESRGIYTAIKDDLDFQALPKDAKLLWYTLKLELGASGIGVCYPGALADMTGIAYPDIEPALAALSAGEWIRRQGNVVWLRNGLRFDPYLSPSNRLHVCAICRHLSGLPKLAIVAEFCRYYGIDPAWITAGVPDPLPCDPSKTVPETLSERDTDTGSRRKEVGGRIQEEGESSRDLPAAPAAAARASGQQRAVENLIAYTGERFRASVEAVAAMPGTGAAWARGLMATWGPAGSMEGDRVPADMRAEIVGIALQRYATDRDRWYGPGFKSFVSKAYADLLEHRAAEQKAEEAKATASEREAWKAREAAEIERLNAEARQRGYDAPVDTDGVIQALSDKLNLKAQGSRT